MYQHLLLDVIVVMSLSLQSKGLENLNTIDVGSARRVEIAGEMLIPIDSHLQAEEVDEKSEGVETDGKTKILMEVGHSKHDKLNFNPEEDITEYNDNIESMGNRKRRSHIHHLGGGCIGGCGVGTGRGYIPVSGFGNDGSHSGSGSFSSAQSSASSSSWSEGGGGRHHKMGYGKK